MMTRSLCAAAPLAERVRRDHAFLRRLFEAVLRAPDAAELRKALWDLYLSFNAHLDMEETKIAPLFRAAAQPNRARTMLLEHNEQRRLLRELLEDAETDACAENALRARASAFVALLVEDMRHEEQALTLLTQKVPESANLARG